MTSEQKRAALKTACMVGGGAAVIAGLYFSFVDTVAVIFGGSVIMLIASVYRWNLLKEQIKTHRIDRGYKD